MKFWRQREEHKFGSDASRCVSPSTFYVITLQKEFTFKLNAAFRKVLRKPTYVYQGHSGTGSLRLAPVSPEHGMKWMSFLGLKPTFFRKGTSFSLHSSYLRDSSANDASHTYEPFGVLTREHLVSKTAARAKNTPTQICRDYETEYFTTCKKCLEMPVTKQKYDTSHVKPPSRR